MGQLTMKITRSAAAFGGGFEVDHDFEVNIDYDYEPTLGAKVVEWAEVAQSPEYRVKLTNNEIDRASALALEQENEE